jgi:PAS domain-containing protein
MNKLKRKRAEKRLPARASARADPLRITEERLGLVTDAMTEGIYDWNVVTNALYLSDRLKSILGIVELTSYKWAEHVHPDDLAT